MAERNSDAAEKPRHLLESSAERLARFPLAWREGRKPGTREMVAHPDYILVYTVEATQIRIVNVLHTARQYPPE